MILKKIAKYFLHRVLHKKGDKNQNAHYFDFFDGLLHQLMKIQTNITFLQLGGNDGKRYDPIYKFVVKYHNNINGVILEPVKDYYIDLERNYKNFSNIITVNKAIHNSLKETTIFKLDKSKEHLAPEFAKGIASFDPNHHKKTNVDSKLIKPEIVKCEKLSSIIKDYKIENIDVLVIDTEGYDYHIIMDIDFNLIQPKIIHFEHGLKSNTMTLNQYDEVFKMLNKMEYQIFSDSCNSTAFKNNLFLK
ncbi:MAG: FkbM family methyltransferase [Flavobacteriaceae bacterium]